MINPDGKRVYSSDCDCALCEATKYISDRIDPARPKEEREEFLAAMRIWAKELTKAVIENYPGYCSPIRRR